jgi:hypothetical protein
MYVNCDTAGAIFHTKGISLKLVTSFAVLKYWEGFGVYCRGVNQAMFIVLFIMFFI